MRPWSAGIANCVVIDGDETFLADEMGLETDDVVLDRDEVDLESGQGAQDDGVVPGCEGR